jgi:phospholipid N-methyltransferase
MVPVAVDYGLSGVKMGLVFDYLVFVRELPKSFTQIGAMLPSSQALGKLMVAPVEDHLGPLSILEVGPGTGPFTRQILSLMGPEDVFVICELNPRFLGQLRKTLEKNQDYQKNRKRVHFFLGPVETLLQSDLPTQYDVVVSSLPFVNFAPEKVEEILSLFRRLTRDGGSMTFLQYLGVCRIRELFADRRTKQRVKAVEQVISSWCKKVQKTGQVRRRRSFLNLPPAVSIEFRY